MAAQAKPPNLRVRFEVLAAWGFRCAYCGRSAKEGARLHVDHVIPQAEHGSHDRDNLVAACSACNLGKGGRYIPAQLVWTPISDAMDWARCPDMRHEYPWYQEGFIHPVTGRHMMTLVCTGCRCTIAERAIT